MKHHIQAGLNCPSILRHVLNWYGPYLGVGVKIKHRADDFSIATVCMPLGWYNKSYVGSLYSMVDPFHMLLIMNQLGNAYIKEIKRRTESGDKYLPEFKVEVINNDGKLVAKALKTLYTRKKPAKTVNH